MEADGIDNIAEMALQGLLQVGAVLPHHRNIE
jgi:hypothetical protein